MDLSSHAYTFLAGLYIGGYTNIFSNLIITGLVTYIIHPAFYTKRRFEDIKNYTWKKVKSLFNSNQTESETIVLSPEETYESLKTPPKTPLAGIKILDSFTS